jgi:hypothetical protein
MNEEKYFLGIRKMRKVSKNAPAVVIGIPPAYLTSTGVDIKNTRFNLYHDIKTNELIISPPKEINLDDPEYEEVIEQADFEAAMDDSAQEELEEKVFEEEGIKIN